MSKLRGKGNYTQKDEVAVFRAICSEMHTLHITMNAERARDINGAMYDLSRAKSNSYNGHYVSDKEHKKYVNLSFWKLAKLVMHPEMFEDIGETK